jgi:hypothetical protein
LKSEEFKFDKVITLTIPISWNMQAKLHIKDCFCMTDCFSDPRSLSSYENFLLDGLRGLESKYFLGEETEATEVGYY